MMPLSRPGDRRSWRHRTPRARLLLWFGWLALVALTVFAWEVMNRDTIWAFVADAPRQAADIGARMVPPRWSYLNELVWPLWETITIATLGTLLAVLLAVPIAFCAARTDPELRPDPPAGPARHRRLALDQFLDLGSFARGGGRTGNTRRYPCDRAALDRLYRQAPL